MSKKQERILKYGLIGLGSLIVAIYVISSLLYKCPTDINLTPDPLPRSLFSIEDIKIFGFTFDLTVRFYGFMIMFGVALAGLYGYYCFLKRCGVDSDTVLGGIVVGVVFGIIGARLYYVVFEPSVVSARLFTGEWFKQVFIPTGGGLAIHGALIGAVISVSIYCYYKKIKIIEVIEIVLPVFMLAQVVGRWGNFFNQEAYGPLVNGYTDATLTAAQLMAQRETLRHLLVPNFIIDQMYLTNYHALGDTVTGYYHPTFLYEGVFNLIGAVTYIQLRKRSNKIYMGDGISFYMIWYGIVRIFIEVLRRDPLTFQLFGVTFKTAIVISVLFIIAGVAMAVLRRVYKYHLVVAKEFLYEGGSLYHTPTNATTVEPDNQDDHENSTENKPESEKK